MIFRFIPTTDYYKCNKCKLLKLGFTNALHLIYNKYEMHLWLSG